MKRDPVATLFAILLLFVLTWVVGYATASFVCWSWNPGEWPVEIRFMTAFVCTFAGAFIVIGGVA